MLLAFVSTSFAASENLTEMELRKSRVAHAVWNNTLLENSSTYVWQPETLMYNDIVTGREVWRITASNSRFNTLPDISWGQFSADGKRFAFGSPRVSAAPGLTSIGGWNNDSNDGRNGALFIVRSDGSFLRPPSGASLRCHLNNSYIHWSPTEPDVFYSPGADYCSEGLSSTQLYRNTIADSSASYSLALSATLPMYLKKGISGDGTKLVAQSSGKFVPITLSSGVGVLDDSDGWNMYRTLDTFWGNTPTTYSGLHDMFVRGVGSMARIFLMPGDVSAWWSFALAGADIDGGPGLMIDNTAPYDWNNAIEPVMTGNGSGGVCISPYRSPWNCDADSATGPEQYMSHPGFDKWGRLVSGSNSQQHQSWGVLDAANGVWVNSNIAAPHFDWHTSWDAWSDYFIASPSAVHDDEFIYTPKYDGTDTIKVADAHVREAGTTAYNSLPRATQSPDGTKVAYHSDMFYPAATAIGVGTASGTTMTITSMTSGAFSVGDLVHTTKFSPNTHIASFGTATGGIGTYNLSQSVYESISTPATIKNGSNGYDILFATAYYPHPPEIISITGTSEYTINFDWGTDRTISRGYTQRGWPNEVTDDPPPPRETKLFRLWRSSNGIDGWEPIKTVDANIFSKYNFATGVWSGSKNWSFTDTPGGGTYYYAVTAQEWSGLESRTLSNIFNTSGTQTKVYPPTPKEDSHFTSGFKSALLRGYNIYAHDGSTPSPTQEMRIATVPASAGISTFLDVFGSVSGDTEYLVKPVDSMGVEGDTLSSTGVMRVTAGQYDVAWTSTPAVDPVCDESHLSLCTSGNCPGFWYNETCNATAEIVCGPPHKDLCTVDNCETTGEGYWCGGSCQSSPCALPGVFSWYRFGSGPEKVTDNE